MAGKATGFRLRHRLGKVFFKWWNFGSKMRKNTKYRKLNSPMTGNSHPISRLFTFIRSLRRGAKRFCLTKSGYILVSNDHDTIQYPNPIKPRKGYLKVYVGDSEVELKTYLVPVIYFNHPLFKELLKEAERVNGFNHPGRITIPCEASEFEKLKKRIASSESSRGRWWNRYRDAIGNSETKNNGSALGPKEKS